MSSEFMHDVLRMDFSLKANNQRDKDHVVDDSIDAFGPITANPLGHRMDLSALPVCPNPKAVPRMDFKHGTTTLGIRIKDGIVMAVDSRASQGQYVASQTVQKVLEINEFMLGTMAGGAADCQFWYRVLSQECRLWELRNGSRITISAASKILANITYSYRNRGLSMGTMVAGFDRFGPHLYYVDDQGDRIKHDIFSVGSGSVYAYGVLDADYKFEMSPEAAIDLARRSIYHATHRDCFSGGWVSVYFISKDGWKKVSRDDQTSLHRAYGLPSAACTGLSP